MPTRDLSHPLDDDVTVYPGDPAVERAPAATHEADGYRVTEIRMGSHAGTHVDAPSHTEPDGGTLDAFDAARFAFDARLVDCSDKRAREPIRPGDLPDDPDADLLAIRTGWADEWGSDAYYDHPYLSEAAARACAENGCCVGVDALSVDPSPSARGTERDGEPAGVPAHHTLLGSERLIVENLTGLSGLPDRFELRAYPLPLPDADGAPVRAVAVW
ncbi:cyclase family protein (plasmid) [Halorussus salilacus]|uniref:cyclase family protein n=1 Tax=Halorussus salilacus TaxID=2953750 RepID=UPI00209E994B|nr:cyclase family protein [Halorussus salilacus]USZ69701.1 cyclase family protein [Halorussus salilacus]